MKTLQKIICMPDKELGAYLMTQLKKYYKHIETDRDNYIYCKGTSPICLVAHIDTVRSKANGPVMLTVTRNVIRNIKGILGADDRAGVYGILEVLKNCVEYKINMPSVLFTNYEESGGGGVKKFVASQKFESEGLNLLIELDRKGCNEYVFYSSTLPKPVKDYVESFGFKEERGSYSDIADLTNEYCIPSVNLSVGYYAQHTANEKLHYDELLMTIDRVVDMCMDPIPKLHTVAKPLYTGHRHYGVYSGDGYGDYYGWNKNANSNHGNLLKGTTGTTGTTGAATSAVVVVKQPTLAGLVDANKIVANIIISLKEEIKTELLNRYILDAIGERYICHEHGALILEKLADIEETFFTYVTCGNSGAIEFNHMWNDMLTKEFFKINPSVVTNTLTGNR